MNELDFEREAEENENRTASINVILFFDNGEIYKILVVIIIVKYLMCMPNEIEIVTRSEELIGVSLFEQ